MALSLVGWLNGLSALLLLIFNCVIGFLFIYQSKKSNVKQLTLAGVVIICTGLLWLGSVADFFFILLTGKNMPNENGLHGILGFVWVLPGLLPAMYIGANLLFPKKKWYIVGFFLILGIIFEFFIFFDTKNVFIFTLERPGEDIIDSSFNRAHICFYLLAIYMISVFILLGIGFLIKAIHSQGIIRKKSIYLSMGFSTFVICGYFEALIAPGAILFVVRLIFMTYALWMYLGLREEPEKKIKLKPKKEITVEGDLFRISHLRPEDLTEEEVSISKEKKICLVCKGKVLRVNFICPECEAFYCMKCASALENLENACWVCNAPIDESKPVRPFEKEGEIEVEISEKPQKKPKTKK